MYRYCHRKFPKEESCIPSTSAVTTLATATITPAAEAAHRSPKAPTGPGRTAVADAVEPLAATSAPPSYCSSPSSPCTATS